MNPEDRYEAFTRLHAEYREDLLIFAYSLLQDPLAAAQMVDRLFGKLWEEADFKKINPPIYKYLTSEIRKMCEK